MATIPPPPPPVELVEPGPPGDPSNRWPWVALGLGLLVIAVAVAFFLINRPRTVNVTVSGTPTVNPLAAASAGPPATIVPPTLPASATLAPTPSPVPSPTPPPPPPTAVPKPTSPPAVQAAPTTPPPPPTAPPAAAPPTTAPATTAPAAAATTAPAAAATTAPAAAAKPTAFAGQPANAGGLGNTRADLDAAYGAPAGETPEHLIAYRKGSFEYHVGLVPDPNGRADLLVALPTPTPVTIEQAMAEAHKLLPKDAQPPNPVPEGSATFVVERYTSQTLAQALPPDVFKGQPGQFMVVYVRDQQARITRFIIGPGNDPNALVSQGR